MALTGPLDKKIPLDCTRLYLPPFGCLCHLLALFWRQEQSTAPMPGKTEAEQIFKPRSLQWPRTFQTEDLFCSAWVFLGIGSVDWFAPDKKMRYPEQHQQTPKVNKQGWGAGIICYIPSRPMSYSYGSGQEVVTMCLECKFSIKKLVHAFRLIAPHCNCIVWIGLVGDIS